MKKQGFTLLELLIVVIIIAILASLALPSYFRAVEHSRISGAELIMGVVVQAQERFKIRRGSGYATDWRSLDGMPHGVADATFLSSPSTYCTVLKTAGTSSETPNAECGNGFEITLVGNSSKDGNNSGVIATRIGNENYGRYQLARFYDLHVIPHYGEVLCSSGEDDTYFAQQLCIDFQTDADSYVPPSQMPSAVVPAPADPTQTPAPGGSGAGN